MIFAHNGECFAKPPNYKQDKAPRGDQKSKNRKTERRRLEEQNADALLELALRGFPMFPVD